MAPVVSRLKVLVNQLPANAAPSRQATLSNGLFARNDFQILYRADRRDVTSSGDTFAPSSHFFGLEPMIGAKGMTTIVSSSLEGAYSYARDEPGSFHIYAIAAAGLPGVSLVENMRRENPVIGKFSASGYAGFQVTDGVIDERGRVDAFEGAAGFDEVHVVGDIEPDRIFLLSSDTSSPAMSSDFEQAFLRRAAEYERKAHHANGAKDWPCQAPNSESVPPTPDQDSENDSDSETSRNVDAPNAVLHSAVATAHPWSDEISNWFESPFNANPVTDATVSKEVAPSDIYDFAARDDVTTTQIYSFAAGAEADATGETSEATPAQTECDAQRDNAQREAEAEAQRMAFNSSPEAQKLLRADGHVDKLIRRGEKLASSLPATQYRGVHDAREAVSEAIHTIKLAREAPRTVTVLNEVQAAASEVIAWTTEDRGSGKTPFAGTPVNRSDVKKLNAQASKVAEQARRANVEVHAHLDRMESSRSITEQSKQLASEKLQVLVGIRERQSHAARETIKEMGLVGLRMTREDTPYSAKARRSHATYDERKIVDRDLDSARQVQRRSEVRAQTETENDRLVVMASNDLIVARERHKSGAMYRDAAEQLTLTQSQAFDLARQNAAAAQRRSEQEEERREDRADRDDRQHAKDMEKVSRVLTRTQATIDQHNDRFKSATSTYRRGAEIANAHNARVSDIITRPGREADRRRGVTAPVPSAVSGGSVNTSPELTRSRSPLFPTVPSHDPGASQSRHMRVENMA